MFRYFHNLTQILFLLQTGRIDFQCCKVIGHNAAVTDLKWCPFNDNIIASGSDDCTVSLIIEF